MSDNTQKGFLIAQFQGGMVYLGHADQLCFTLEVNFPQDGLTVNQSVFLSIPMT